MAVIDPLMSVDLNQAYTHGEKHQLSPNMLTVQALLTDALND